jgi:hypothetical protein
MTIFAKSALGKCSPVRPIVNEGDSINSALLERAVEFWYAYASRPTKGGKLSTPTLVRLLDTTQVDQEGNPYATVEYPTGGIQTIPEKRIIDYDYEGECDDTGEVIAGRFLMAQLESIENRNRPKRGYSNRGTASRSVWGRITKYLNKKWFCETTRPNIAKPRAGGRDRSRRIISYRQAREAVGNVFDKVDRAIDYVKKEWTYDGWLVLVKGRPYDHATPYDNENGEEERGRREAVKTAHDVEEWFQPDTPRGVEVADPLECALNGILPDTPTRVKGDNPQSAAINKLSADPENWPHLEQLAREYFDRQARLAKNKAANKAASRKLGGRKKSTRKSKTRKLSTVLG